MQFLSACLGINEKGHLTIGGADVVRLAEEYGTPAYIMSEDEIRNNCRAFVNGMKIHYEGDFQVVYASKALSVAYLYTLCAKERLGADVVSGGELYTALRGGMPPESIYFHGNNKTEEELCYAIESGVRCFVLDNPDELRLLDHLSGNMGKTVRVAVRLKPGIEAHTHNFVQTGQSDSKFGVAIETGEAMEMVREILSCRHVTLLGVHCHIGSQIFDAEPFELAVEVLMKFMAEVSKQCGYDIKELNLGGGFGIRYTPEDDPRAIGAVVKATTDAVTKNAQKLSYPLPRLVLEPGRSIVGSAGITVYRAGSLKRLPETGLCVSVDGGMTDNIRYALYGAQYQAVIPERAAEPQTEIVSIAGRCCESSDFIGKQMPLQPVKAGDYLAVLATGAYNYSMASNYNRIPRPPIIMVRGGEPFVMVMRETWEDVARLDVLP